MPTLMNKAPHRMAFIHHKVNRCSAIAILSILFVLLLASCDRYDVKLNDRVLYTPGPLFEDFELTDPALGDCVRQTIEDGKITRATGLTRLNCSHAGIADLSGLQRFSALEQLKLSDNRIEDITPLLKLEHLAELYLDGNRLRDVSGLLLLPHLGVLDLSGNATLQCPANAGRQAISSLLLPAHCTTRD